MSESHQPQSPSPVWPLQRREHTQQQGDQSSQQATSMSSNNDPICIDFARTRSPFSIDQIDQTTRYCQAHDGDHDDTEPETANLPPPRISPFAVGFMTASTETSVFGKSKAVLPKQAVEIPVDVEKAQDDSNQQPIMAESQDIASENATDDGSPQPGTYLEDPTNQDQAEEIPEDVHTITERPDINEYFVNVDLPVPNDTTEPITPPGILTILDEEIDRQFTDKWHGSLEPDSTGSSSLTIIVPDGLEEPQQTWISDVYRALGEAGHGSINTESHVPLRVPAFAINQTQGHTEHEKDSTKEGSSKEVRPVTSYTKVTQDASINQDQDKESISDATMSAEPHISNSVPPPRRHSDIHCSAPFTSNSPDASPGQASTGATPPTSVLIDSPDGSEKIVFRPSVPYPQSVQLRGLERLKKSPPSEARHQNRKSEIPDDWPSTEPLDLEEIVSSQTIKCYEGDIFPNRKPPRPSLASSESYTDCGDDTRRVSPDIEETFSPTVPGLSPQTQMLTNQALQEFKVDLLQQIEDTVTQSIRAVIPARNSAAATMLARPSPPQMEEAIRASVSVARGEIMDRIESGKAEAIGCALRMAEINKEHSTEIADTLKKTLVEHIDHRLEVFERMLVERFDPSQFSTQNEAHLKAVITGLLPSETTLTGLSEVLEQARAITNRDTAEISKKLEQYTAKTEAISNLCTRLDETIASKQHIQTEIVNNLCNILNQSTLQNNAINDLAAVISPLATTVRGISYDTNLIDAKLAKNADILVSVTERTEALEMAAARLGGIIVDAEAKLKRVTTKMEKVAKTASAVNEVYVERFEGLQGQMTTMQARLDEVAAVMRRGPIEVGADVSGSAKQYPVNIRSTNAVSDSPPTTPIDINNLLEPAYDTVSTRVEIPDSPPDSLQDPLEPSFTITATFKLPNRKDLNLQPATFPISESTTVPTIVSAFRLDWTQELLDQGVLTAKIELLSVWVSSGNSATSRVVDNDKAYAGWYRGVVRRGSRGGTELKFEFMVCGKDGIGEGGEGHKSKKRKQEVVERGDEDGVVFSLGIWANARQTRFERVSGYERVAGYDQLVSRLIE